MRKHFPIPTPESLAKAALRYLERFAASEASLRRVLENRLQRATISNPDFAHDEEANRILHAVIDQLVEKHKKTGALNDAFFAEIKVNSLRRQGRSRRAILQKLGAKGIHTALIASALDKNAEGASNEETELAAATALARRRKMGPFHKGPLDDVRKRKELASLARAGFSLDIARRVLYAELPEDSE